VKKKRERESSLVPIRYLRCALRVTHKFSERNRTGVAPTGRGPGSWTLGTWGSCVNWR
jgi:hypothetical protein